MVNKKRHLAKTVTWRIIASITTFVLALVFFGDDPSIATKATLVVIFESVIKMVYTIGTNVLGTDLNLDAK